MSLLPPVDITVGDGCKGIAHYALNLLFSFCLKEKMTKQVIIHRLIGYNNGFLGELDHERTLGGHGVQNSFGEEVDEKGRAIRRPHQKQTLKIKSRR